MPSLSLAIAFFLLLLLALGYYYQIFYLFVIVIELWLPGFLLTKFHEDPHKYALHAHGIETLNIKLINFNLVMRDIFITLLFSIFILIPYVLIYYFYMSQTMAFELKWPDDFLYQIPVQIFLVALPEENFSRGFLQHSLQKKYPVWLSIILTNILFALGHFVGGFNPFRLLTFFPGLVFSYLVYKTGSIFSPILFHALCNLLEKVLIKSFI